MLGYVRINKGELKVKEYELYRGLYCSLCRALGKEYGQLSRLVLSYDATFVVLLALAVKDVTPDFRKGRCPFNPSKKCCYCLNGADSFVFAAAVSMMLFYFKVRDNIRDGKFFSRVFAHIILPYAKRKFKKAAAKYPSLALEISVLMDEQSEIERENSDDVDKAADPSAKALGLIFEEIAKEKNGLYDFGYALGRWVYLSDAADDIESDLKSGSYNVFVNKYGLQKGEKPGEELKESLEKELNLSAGVTAEWCEKLELNYLLPIIENVIFDGTASVTQNILHGD